MQLCLNHLRFLCICDHITWNLASEYFGTIHISNVKHLSFLNTMVNWHHIRWEGELEKDEQSALLGEAPLPRRTLRRLERQVNVFVCWLQLYIYNHCCQVLVFLPLFHNANNNQAQGKFCFTAACLSHLQLLSDFCLSFTILDVLDVCPICCLICYLSLSLMSTVL